MAARWTRTGRSRCTARAVIAAPLRRACSSARAFVRCSMLPADSTRGWRRSFPSKPRNARLLLNFLLLLFPVEGFAAEALGASVTDGFRRRLAAKFANLLAGLRHGVLRADASFFLGGRISWRNEMAAVFFNMAATEQYFSSLNSMACLTAASSSWPRSL